MEGLRFNNPFGLVRHCDCRSRKFPSVTLAAGICCDVKCDKACANAFMSNASAGGPFTWWARVGAPTEAPSESEPTSSYPDLPDRNGALKGFERTGASPTKIAFTNRSTLPSGPNYPYKVWCLHCRNRFSTNFGYHATHISIRIIGFTCVCGSSRWCHSGTIPLPST